MRFRAVTFDLDGTLLDTVPDLALACNRMLLELGERERSLAEIHRFVGKGMVNLVTRCLTDDAPPSVEKLAAGVEAFKRHYTAVNGAATTVYPQVLAGLQAWQASGLPLAVVTNKPLMFTLPLLEKMGMAEFFRVVVGGDSTAEKKPHPEPILFACRQLGVAPEQNLHIGDSANDVLAARAAGSAAWCVPYGYNEGAAVDSADCDALVSDLLQAFYLATE